VDIHIDVSLIQVNAKKLRKLSLAKIRQYIRAYEAGHNFPAIIVVDCGSFYIIRDGRHRYQAQLACGFQLVSAVVVN
jgi:hypothetical protein